MKTYNIGIIGAGHIAIKMARTLAAMPQTCRYAIASRDKEKAATFAREYGFLNAYGSYGELINNPHVDLIYIATPHAFHYEQMRLCIENGKAVLCEKSFTANAQQAIDILNLAEEKQVFVTEAIWTRYLPMSRTIAALVKEGAIGTPYMLTANLGYAVTDRPRLIRPDLAGGALLDMGVYALNFAAMIFGNDLLSMHSSSILTESGVDGQDNITQIYSLNRMAVLTCSMFARMDRQGIVSGDKGHLIVDNINNPQRVRVVDQNYQQVAEYFAPPQITGFEYQVAASLEALEKGFLQTMDMPHDETIRIMKQMDALRESWGVCYPFE